MRRIAVFLPGGCRNSAGLPLAACIEVGCLFVDDDPQLVLAAIQQGYRGAALNRSDEPWAVSVPTVTSLDEVLPIVAGR
ncbi:hypothetical protein [Allorhizocola rhizosphaerae]|uniref:hypothetical protein n=1 Tax=Allorhizocola rhizosphaerae TaxID=1872709 RepID=UPI0013C37BFD|nr:hypothetical protein [Allorhizocola rhizosphaerae]